GPARHGPALALHRVGAGAGPPHPRGDRHALAHRARGPRRPLVAVLVPPRLRRRGGTAGNERAPPDRQPARPPRVPRRPDRLAGRATAGAPRRPGRAGTPRGPLDRAAPDRKSTRL